MQLENAPNYAEELSAWVGLLALVVSSFALLSLLRSLAQTDTAIQDGRYFGRAQNRAYVTVQEVYYQPMRDDSRTNFGSIYLSVVNTGGTPALWYKTLGEIRLHCPEDNKESPKGYSHFKDVTGVIWSALPNGRGENIVFRADQIDSVIGQSLEESRTVVVDGCVIYETVFNEVRYSEFFFTGIPYQDQARSRFSHHPRGTHSYAVVDPPRLPWWFRR